MKYDEEISKLQKQRTIVSTILNSVSFAAEILFTKKPAEDLVRNVEYYILDSGIGTKIWLYYKETPKKLAL